MGDQVLAFDVTRIGGEIAEASIVSAVHKTQVGVKSGTDVLIHGVEFQFARGALHVELVGGTGLMSAVVELGFAGDGLSVHLPVLVDFDLSVKSADAIESHNARSNGAKAVGRGVQFAVSEDESYAVIFSHFAVEAQHA